MREAQRHLALLGEETTAKLDQPVALDVMRPVQAFHAGGRARALSAVIKALADAKEAGIEPEAALHLVDWGAVDAA